MKLNLPQMDSIFRQIEQAYEHFYRSLHRTEGLPYRSTASGMWAVSGSTEVYAAFRHFDLNRYHHLADLGSGDGKVVLIASLFTRATGYETDEELYRKSLEIQAKLKLTRARFLLQNYLQADLRAYDFLFIYPDKPLYPLEARLYPCWRGRLLVKGPHFPPRHLRKIAQAPPSVGRFVLYQCG